MCGITGFWDRSLPRADSLRADAEAMAATLWARGPDSAGIWIDPSQGIGLGHRRLAILDLSAEGHQPMASGSGRYVITFNGEVYNHRELRRDLEAAGTRFRGNSDTEVMLAAIESYGMLEAARRFTGMFAFAVWDRKERRLSLCRDRLGEKPLYYGTSRGVFLFGSQFRALQAHHSWAGQIDRESVSLFLRHNCVPAPRSIFSGFRKLLPGTVFHLEADGSQRDEVYWSPSETAQEALLQPFRGGEKDAADALEALLRGIIARQMVSDVPLGAFLSGGIDSSMVVALMQERSSAPVRTFTLGFDEAGYDEAPFAREIAKALGTRHTELRVSPAQVMEVIPELPRIFDEPFADSSQVPTYIVAKLTRQHVTVSLSGDGADELFSGYDRYSWGEALQRRISRIPAGLRDGLSAAIRSVPVPVLDAASHLLGRSKGSAAWSGDRLHKVALMIREREPWTLYRQLISHWGHPSDVLLDAPHVDSRFSGEKDWLRGGTFRNQMMLADQLGYLPDDILAKVDRACMAVGLESRCPFLDHELFRFAWSLPGDFQFRNGQGKWLLRKVLERHIPISMFDRPKMGFRMPIQNWLRGPLRDWAESLLDPDVIRRQGFFRADVILRKWREHLAGTRNWYYQIWDILMFQAWLENYASVRVSASPGRSDVVAAFAEAGPI